MKRTLPLISFFIVLCNLNLKSQAVTPYATCPDVNIAIARAGMNSDVTNPFFLYNVNQSTGAMTLVPGGPFKDPSDNTKNLQVNGVGINRKDGFIYGMSFEGTVTTQKFVRLDKNYGVTSLGYIPSPVSATGMVGIVNHAAGEMDTSGNYYFTAITVNPFTPTPTIDKYFVGKISRTDTIPAGSAVAVEYYQIDMSTACSNYISTLTANPENSGLKDFAFDARTKSFFGYATYKMPGATNFSAQLIEIKAVAGSSPLRYMVICNPIVNTHTAETAGTLIDKAGKLTNLFTDGSFGSAVRDQDGVYTGAYTHISNSTGLPNPLRADMASCGQRTSSEPPAGPVSCPDANIAVLRAGMNADTLNPTHIYSLNTITGQFTKFPGGYLAWPGYPTRPLHVNGVGVNKTDGFIYGLANDLSSQSAKLVRFDYEYGVQIIGSVLPPTSPSSSFAVVNTAAGAMDRFNNYYFTAFTGNIDVNSGLPVMDKVFIGKIPNVSMLNGNATPQYFDIQVTDPNCAAWINSIFTDPNNSGLKDLVISGFTQNIYSYATYKPAGSPGFVGQLVEFRPIPGSSPLRYMLVCNGVLNNHNGETSGVAIDKLGNFLIMLTDGTVGKMQTSGSMFNYTGVYVPLNNNTGLPNPLRGDLASCGEAEGGPLPLHLLSFNAKENNCRSVFVWTSENEVNFRQYELQQSFDNSEFNTVQVIMAKGGNSKNSYSYTLGSAGKHAFYRLKMLDIDGRTTYSSVISFNSSCKNFVAGFMINPNPVNEVLNLNWYGLTESTSAAIRIFDTYGKEVMNLNTRLGVGNPLVKLNVNKLAAGTYFIKVVDSKNKVYDQKFMKK